MKKITSQKYLKLLKNTVNDIDAEGNGFPIVISEEIYDKVGDQEDIITHDRITVRGSNTISLASKVFGEMMNFEFKMDHSNCGFASMHHLRYQGRHLVPPIGSEIVSTAVLKIIFKYWFESMSIGAVYYTSVDDGRTDLLKSLGFKVISTFFNPNSNNNCDILLYKG